MAVTTALDSKRRRSGRTGARIGQSGRARAPRLRMNRAGVVIDTIAMSEPVLAVMRLSLAPSRGFTIAGETVFSKNYSYRPWSVAAKQRDRVLGEMVDNIAAVEKQVPRGRIEQVVKEAARLPAFHP